MIGIAHRPTAVCHRVLLVCIPSAHCPHSHLQGMFNRTIKMLESGVKPVYVFDGSAPSMKSGTVREPLL